MTWQMNNKMTAVEGHWTIARVMDEVVECVFVRTRLLVVSIGMIVVVVAECMVESKNIVIECITVVVVCMMVILVVKKNMMGRFWEVRQVSLLIFAVLVMVEQVGVLKGILF
jgi:hypothetical protein